MIFRITLASAASVAGASLATARVVTGAIVGCKRLLWRNPSRSITDSDPGDSTFSVYCIPRSRSNEPFCPTSPARPTGPAEFPPAKRTDLPQMHRAASKITTRSGQFPTNPHTLRRQGTNAVVTGTDSGPGCLPDDGYAVWAKEIMAPFQGRKFFDNRSNDRSGHIRHQAQTVRPSAAYHSQRRTRTQPPFPSKTRFFLHCITLASPASVAGGACASAQGVTDAIVRCKRLFGCLRALFLTQSILAGGPGAH